MAQIERSSRFNWNPTRGSRAKWDMQLKAGVEAENLLGAILTSKKIEVKSESYMWEKTGNLCIEYYNRGQPSGIASTEADHWAHELVHIDAEGKPVSLGFVVIPIARMKQLARQAIDSGRLHKEAGDESASRVALVKIEDIFKVKS